MVARYVSLRRLIAACFGIWLFASAPTASKADGEENAGAFLTSVSERAIRQLADTSVGELERQRRFRGLLQDAFDLRAIGRFVLGPYWRRATTEERTAFLEIFEVAIVQRFLPLFGRYSGQKILVTRLHEDRNLNGHFIVSSIITEEQGEPVKVDWRIRARDDGFHILDVVAEGVSFALTLRQEYASVIKNAGGVDGLVEQLREKLPTDGFAEEANASSVQ